MRFIIMHKTNAHWESGAIPSRELIARVGALLGELAKAGVLLGAEGLRASSEGVRLRFSAGTRTVINGPFEGNNELPAGFSILRARVAGGRNRVGHAPGERAGDVEIDIRPVTEPWDIGMVRRRQTSARAATWSCARPHRRRRLAKRRLPHSGRCSRA